MGMNGQGDILERRPHLDRQCDLGQQFSGYARALELSKFKDELYALSYTTGATKPDSMIDDTNAANSGGDQPRSEESSVCTKSRP